MHLAQLHTRHALRRLRYATVCLDVMTLARGARRLIMEMLRETPRIIPSADGKLSAFVDPIGTMERILRMRSQIAKDWCAELAQVPSGQCYRA